MTLQRRDSSSMRRDTARRAFTMMESLVLLGIFIILLSIFIPYIHSIREANKRTQCVANLSRLLSAMQSYARDNGGDFPRVVYDPINKPEGYTAFTGPDDNDPFAPPLDVGSSNVTASLWLLVRGKYVADTGLFICPSSDDSRDLMLNASGQSVSPLERGNFRKPTNLSYSYASPFTSVPGFRMNDTKPSGFVLMADKNPGEAAAMHTSDAPPDQLAKANSPNHYHAGQNVLFAYGNVEFQKTPYCGIGGDNIYTARAASLQATTQPTTLPNNVPGVVGMEFSPVRNDDSYLVPTANDPWPLAALQAPIRATPATRLSPSTAATLPSTTSATTATSSPAATTTTSSPAP